jgi:nitrite reductase/ring-hydroxylating ferredoxin subunit
VFKDLCMGPKKPAMIERKTNIHHKIKAITRFNKILSSLFQTSKLCLLLLTSANAYYCYSRTKVRYNGSILKDSSTKLSFGDATRLVSRTSQVAMTLLRAQPTPDDKDETDQNNASSQWAGRLAKRVGRRLSFFSNGSSDNNRTKQNVEDDQPASTSESIVARIRNRLPFRKEKVPDMVDDEDIEPKITEIFLAEVNEQTQKERLLRQQRMEAEQGKQDGGKIGAMQFIGNSQKTKGSDKPEERGKLAEIQAMEQGQEQKALLAAAMKWSSLAISALNSTRSNKDEAAGNSSSLRNASKSGLSIEVSSFPSYIQSLIGETVTSGLNATQSFFYDSITSAATKLTSDLNKLMKGDDNWVVVCPKTRISPGEAVPVVVEGLNLLLIASNDAKQLYCVANQCPHLGTPLETGKLERRPKTKETTAEQGPIPSSSEDCIVCPLHHTAFALDSGEVRGEWCPYPPMIGSLMGAIKPQANLPTFAVRVRGKNIEVRLNSVLEDNDKIENKS